MLPDGFHWTRRIQYDDDEIAVALNDRQVAFLLKRNDGTWFARLDVQRGAQDALVLRDCTSFESGKAGIEMWVCRHEARLRAEVAAMDLPAWTLRSRPL